MRNPLYTDPAVHVRPGRPMSIAAGLVRLSITPAHATLAALSREDSDVAQFMLLLYQSPNPPARSPEDMQRSLEKYMAWMKKPFTLDGKRLAGDAGKVIRP